MQYQIETHTGQRIVLEDIEQLEFAAGGVTEAYRHIYEATTSEVSYSPSVRDVQGHVLRGLFREIPILGIEDICELRVLLDVAINEETPLGVQIAAIFQEAVQIIARWAGSQPHQRGTPA